MKNITNYNDFIKLNEGLFNQVVRSIGKWAAAPLEDLMKDISKAGDAKKIATELKNYVNVSAQGIDNNLKDKKTVGEVNTYLTQAITSLYTALIGVKNTNKFNKTYFEEIFKDTDKELVKRMNTKYKSDDEITKSFGEYVSGVLTPNLQKIAATEKIGTEETTEPQTAGKKENFDKKYKIFEEAEAFDPEAPATDALKTTVKNWILKLLNPILKINPKPIQKLVPTTEMLPTSDGYTMRRDQLEDLFKNANFNQIKKFRDLIVRDLKASGQMVDPIKRWPLNKPNVV